MAKILMASAPLSGHVNPGLLIARCLAGRGHEVVWYCGSHYRDRIIATGARFEPFRQAPDYHDQTISKLHGPIPVHSLLAHAIFYIRYIFYDSMPAYYEDMKEILRHFDADIILADEWFTGGVPFCEKGEKPVVLFSISPLMILTDDAPAPGTGLLPDNSIYGRQRDRIVNFITRFLFRGLERDINRIRDKVGLPKMDYFFLEQNIRHSTLTLKFTTPAFEFPRKNIPESIKFVGPLLPDAGAEMEFPWTERLKQDRPVIFITQGSVDIGNINKLIFPALKALQDKDMLLIVSTGGKPVEDLTARFPSDKIIFERFIPYSHIMPYVSIMITNGGYGGVSTALLFGVPLIVAGNSEEKPEIASRIAYCRAGINLRTGTPSVRQIGKAVHRILNDPTYRINAEKIMRDFQKHDAVTESALHIEELIDTLKASEGKHTFIDTMPAEINESSHTAGIKGSH